MIERLIEASIRNRFLVLILAAGMSVAGLYAVFDTPINAIADLSENQVIVFTDWMGRSPREIEDQVSRKLQGLAGVKAVRSSSEFNFSRLSAICVETRLPEESVTRRREDAKEDRQRRCLSLRLRAFA